MELRNFGSNKLSAQLVTGLVALVIALWLIFEPKAKTVQDAGKGDAIHFKADAIAGIGQNKSELV